VVNVLKLTESFLSLILDENNYSSDFTYLPDKLCIGRDPFSLMNWRVITKQKNHT